MVRILTNETPVEELQRKFREELTGKMKEAALKLGCNVEELKYRVNNAGIVEIERMSGNEMIERVADDATRRLIHDVKRARRS